MNESTNPEYKNESSSFAYHNTSDDGTVRHHRDGVSTYVNKFGTEFWYLNGQLHRDDGPAIVRKHGANEWYKHGKHHRIDGPAVDGPDGCKEWWIDGKFQREVTP